MKYYDPKNAEGRIILCSTQKDAAAVNKTYGTIEIPTDKEGLQQFAQEALDAVFYAQQGNEQGQTTQADEIEPDEAPGKPITPIESSVTPKLPASWEANDIQDFILNRANVAQVENIFQTLGTRFKELAKGLQ